MKKYIEENVGKLSIVLIALGSILILLGLVDGVVHLSRVGQFLFSCGATAYIIEDANFPRPRGTTMIAMGAFMLTLEGFTQIMTNGIEQTSYYQIAIGLYLMIALWQMVRIPKENE